MDYAFSYQNLRLRERSRQTAVNYEGSAIIIVDTCVEIHKVRGYGAVFQVPSRLFQLQFRGSLASVARGGLDFDRGDSLPLPRGRLRQAGPRGHRLHRQVVPAEPGIILPLVL